MKWKALITLYVLYNTAEYDPPFPPFLLLLLLMTSFWI